MDKTLQGHWDTIYKTKKPQEVSWTQEIPKASLDFIHSFHLTKASKIIHIGVDDSSQTIYWMKVLKILPCLIFQLNRWKKQNNL